MIVYRTLTEQDVTAYRALRLTALLVDADAFGSTYEEEVGMIDDDIANRLKPDNHKMVIGAFDGELLIGMVGVYADLKVKLSHKGTIWGMFVMPEYRGIGIGKSLLREAIVRAGAMETIEQLNLCVVSENEAAKNLYLSLGFQVFGYEKHAMKTKDGRYIDEDYLVLFL
ncbi:MAG: GNAT family N-acetyltransferase [Ignavibacteria bacterium]|nr:GNAT family N-acetyltransferase [Ignavibacteria bacterium]